MPQSAEKHLTNIQTILTLLVTVEGLWLAGAQAITWVICDVYTELEINVRDQDELVLFNRDRTCALELFVVHSSTQIHY